MIPIWMLGIGVTLAPAGDPGTWIRPDDYPASERDRGVEGTTAFILDVDDKGHVTECTIEQSSGSVALDVTTCAVLKVRATFTPARNAKGYAVPSTYRSRIVWKLPSGTPVDISTLNRSVAIAVDIDEKGVIESCRAAGAAAPKQDEVASECKRFVVGNKTPPLTVHGQPAKIRITMTQTILAQPR